MILGRTDSRGRLGFLLLVFVLFAGALVARLGWWQIARRDDLAGSAQRQIYLRTEVPAVRGAIYDRSGTVVLADSVTRDRLIANPKRLTARDREALVNLLVERLGLDATATAAIRDRLSSDRTYVVAARDLAPEDTDAIVTAAQAMGIAGLSVESAQVRLYPQSGGGPLTSLAAHLLGFVNREGSGQYGIEQYYQDLLAGSPTVVESDRDANGQPVRETQHIVSAGTPGSDLSLTIDAGLQLAVEQEVMAAWVADQARSVSAIVIDPYTGAILAEATYPSYDANDYATVASVDPGRFIDPVIAEVYEPGSVFKMLTVIAGLESGTVTMSTEINDTGTLKLDKGRTKVDDADRRAMGVMRLEDAIAYSRNVVAAKVALGLAPTTQDAAEALYEVWTRLGFGTRTGIDVAGEVAGLVRNPADKPWREIDLANGSFGQGVAVTPLQLAAAYAAMVNGGTLVSPHVVGAIDGQPVTVTDRGRVLEPSLSPILTQLMNHVVTSVPFYRDRTLIPGYDVGGKTGTAQIWDTAAGDWKSGVFNFSFVGFVGRRVANPDLVISVLINEGRPSVRRVGQLAMPAMSFELFRRIATDAMAIPGLLPELPPLQAPSGRLGD
ncbi:MAG: penicillin-binding protein 2 [Chloroflexota bacterium]